MADVSNAITEHAADGQYDDHAGRDKLYLIVFAILCVCTAASFVIFEIFKEAKMVALFLIVAVAVLKATLVITYFMHLKWDWRMVYFIMAPVCILAVMMIIILLPDSVLTWHHYAYDDTPAHLETKHH